MDLKFGIGDAVMLLATLGWVPYTMLLRRFNLPFSGVVLLTVLVGLDVLMLLPFYL